MSLTSHFLRDILAQQARGFHQQDDDQHGEHDGVGQVGGDVGLGYGLNDAQQQAAQIKSKAAADIELEKKNAINEAKNEISDLAMAIAGKVVARELNAGDQADMIDRFIDELGDNV